MKSVIFFSSQHCGPCRAMKPVVQELCDQNNVDLFEYDIEFSGNLAREYGVMSVPVLVEKDNKENRLTGLQSRDKVQAFLA